ncbi:MAG: phosphoserine phosphatase RsbU/P [Gaiellales bacterium]|nr:phosphoserine phosphatase RsbU/P [Gaiellales bacterium]
MTENLAQRERVLRRIPEALRRILRQWEPDALADTQRARKLVAATLYTVFVPLAVGIELSGGADDRHPALFWAITAALVAQWLYTVVMPEIGDTAALVFVIAVPATYAGYAGLAFQPTDQLWPCLVLPVVWTSLFLPARLVLLSVSLNGLAGVSSDVWDRAAHISAAVAVVRVGTLAVAAAIIYTLVSQVRTSRDRYQRAAQTLERTLVPAQIPFMQGMSIAAVYRPATGTFQVGGDFYDVFPCPDGSFVVCVGDVQGKGLEAAAVTGLVRHELRHHLYVGHTPTEALARLNALLLNHPSRRFITLVIVKLTVGDGVCEIEMARAGHPPPILWRDGATTELDGGKGPAVGIYPESAFEQMVELLTPGDLLVLYTDGVVEARRGSELFGPERLAAAVERHADSPPGELCDHLVAELMQFADDVRDDAIVLTVAVEPRLMSARSS